MPARYVLAIDAGTSGVYCLIADLNGKVVSLCRQKWNYKSLAGSLGKEFAPEQFWSIICRSIKETLGRAGINPEDIAAVSATSQREGTVFLDKDGGELYAGPNIDLRALSEGISIDNEFGSVVHRLTGHAPSFLFVPAKLKWFETNQPETYSKITTVFTISDWIIFRLSGERVSEICGASELGLIDIQHCQWAWKLKELLNLPDDIYPELVTAGSRVGEVTPQAAAETGLLKGTPVVAGAPDTHCGLIGMGVKKKGQAGIVLGWSAPIQMLTDEPIFDPKIWTGCYPLRERWILESSAGEAGNAYHWLKEIIFGEGDSSGENSYQLMDHLALRAPLGAEEVRAFIGPATMDMSRLRLKFGGFLFPLPLSVVNIKRDHLVRASLENICFAIKANCHQLEAISGLKLDEVRLGGSLAKSQCLTQILPSVLEMSISIPEITEVSALGAAICAAVGVGAYSTLEEGMEAMTPQLRVVEPDRLSTLEYAEYYQKWVITSRWLQKLSEEIK